jgi:hypothetical protein
MINYDITNTILWALKTEPSQPSSLYDVHLTGWSNDQLDISGLCKENYH